MGRNEEREREIHIGEKRAGLVKEGGREGGGEGRREIGDTKCIYMYWLYSASVHVST